MYAIGVYRIFGDGAGKVRNIECVVAKWLVGGSMIGSRSDGLDGGDFRTNPTFGG